MWQHPELRLSPLETHRRTLRSSGEGQPANTAEEVTAGVASQSGLESRSSTHSPNRPGTHTELGLGVECENVVRGFQRRITAGELVSQLRPKKNLLVLKMEVVT